MTTASVAYIVRAVTPGALMHPAATVEDMYEPTATPAPAAGGLDGDSEGLRHHPLSPCPALAWGEGLE